MITRIRPGARPTLLDLAQVHNVARFLRSQGLPPVILGERMRISGPQRREPPFDLHCWANPRLNDRMYPNVTIFTWPGHE